MPETTDRVWDGLTRASPSSPTCPAASWDGFLSARALGLFAVAPDREDELRPFEREDLLVVFDLEREFEFDPLDLDDVPRFEPLGDPLRLDRLAVDDFLDPPVERRAVERVLELDRCFATSSLPGRRRLPFSPWNSRRLPHGPCGPLR